MLQGPLLGDAPEQFAIVSRTPRPVFTPMSLCLGRVHAKGVVVCERAYFCLLSTF